MKFITWLEDHILSFIQKRCSHPKGMVAADILEGCAGGIQVKYCRRCGSIKTDWEAGSESGRKFISIEHFWRTPDPNLWRG